MDDVKKTLEDVKVDVERLKPMKDKVEKLEKKLISLLLLLRNHKEILRINYLLIAGN